MACQAMPPSATTARRSGRSSSASRRSHCRQVCFSAVVGLLSGGAQCTAAVNIRFNDAHSSATLIDWLRATADTIAAQSGTEITLTTKVSGESFFTEPGPLSDLIAGAVHAETGLRPELSTSGGTSDARFVKAHCPVVEFGLVGKTMHKVDENVSVEHIQKLKKIYTRVLRDYFA